MSLRSAFIAVIGRPNVGKSTLVNAIMGEKVSIVSPKAQTTRNKINAIYTEGDVQLVFVDTPGIHRHQTELGQTMNRAALSALSDVDVVCWVIDASKPFGRGDEAILTALEGLKQPVILVLNKFDEVGKGQMADLLNAWVSKYPFAHLIPVSALKGTQVPELIELLTTYTKESPHYYPQGMVSDRPESFFIAELVREQVLRYTNEEVPHSVAVVIDQYETKGENALSILASIIVERDSQKGIIIGAGGQMLKRITQSAVIEATKALQAKVDLRCFVKVEKDWRNRPHYLKEFGYTTKD